MKKIFFCFIYFYCSFCLAQNSNPQPPFCDVYRRPNVHPYTFISPNSNAMDYQQMFYLQNKTESILSDKQQSKQKNMNVFQYNIQMPQSTIRPTGHKSYFMTLP